MKNYFLNYQNNRYSIEGSKSIGYKIYVLKSNSYIYIGNSICDTPKRAIIDVLNKQYRTYY
jgi:hypothetical protein